MTPLKARVKNGRLVLDVATDLPEGTVVTLEVRLLEAPNQGIRASVADMIDESYVDDDSGNLEVFPTPADKRTRR